MGGILSYNVETEDNNFTVETIEENTVDKSTQSYDTSSNWEDLELKVEYLGNFCKKLENRILNLEKGRRTVLL